MIRDDHTSNYKMSKIDPSSLTDINKKWTLEHSVPANGENGG